MKECFRLHYKRDLAGVIEKSGRLKYQRDLKYLEMITESGRLDDQRDLE